MTDEPNPYDELLDEIEQKRAEKRAERSRKRISDKQRRDLLRCGRDYRVSVWHRSTLAALQRKGILRRDDGNDGPTLPEYPNSNLTAVGRQLVDQIFRDEYGLDVVAKREAEEADEKRRQAELEAQREAGRTRLAPLLKKLQGVSVPAYNNNRNSLSTNLGALAARRQVAVRFDEQTLKELVALIDS